MVNRKYLYAIPCIAVLTAVALMSAFPAHAQEANNTPDDAHYVFAHKALPSLLFTKKEALFRTFENRGQKFVEDLWARVAKTTGKENDTRGKLLEYSKENLAGTPVYLVKLPPPAGIAQAFYVAVLEKDGKPRYFTVELTFKESGCPSMTILGEWLPEARHKNHGCGPKPDKQEFLKAIAAHL